MASQDGALAAFGCTQKSSALEAARSRQEHARTASLDTVPEGGCESAWHAWPALLASDELSIQMNSKPSLTTQGYADAQAMGCLQAFSFAGPGGSCGGHRVHRQARSARIVNSSHFVFRA